MTTDAKSYGADLITLDKILPFEERERRAGIGDQLIGLELRIQLDPCFHALLIIAVLHLWPGAVEEVWCQRHIPLAGYALSHAADVGIDAEDLHEHQHGRARSRVRGPGQVAAHGLAIDVDVDPFSFDFHR